jgi:carboxymethylenebutenolidase
MPSQTIDIKTKDGLARCQFFTPPQSGIRPAVILYMDAFGVRPALCGMAERLAAAGYHVLLPDLYYRVGQIPAFDAATAFSDPAQREKLMSLVKSLRQKMVMEDTSEFLAYLQSRPDVGRSVGCVGYCMGGSFALSAAGTFPDRIAAAASFHGGRLATDQPDSPHLLAPKMRGEIYVGIAGLDANFTPAEKQRLESALQTAGVKHTVEVYPNVKHGFAVSDHSVYDRSAAELHWQRLLGLFAKNLPST